jgi:hypothetical protein
MPKNAISITLDQDNLLWLRAQTAAAKGKSLSETIDRLVTDARAAGRVAPGTVRSVVGTIDISDADPDLLTADEYVRGLYEHSHRQPVFVRETAPARRAPAKRRGSRATSSNSSRAKS